MKERFDYIDGLRGIAILGVIMTHAASKVSYDGILSLITNKLGYGVQLFFLVSAFTIFYTLDSSKKSEKNLFGNFFIKRLFRIAPIYWLGIALYTIVFGLNSRGWLPGPEIWHFPLHITFTNLLHPETPSSVVPGGWSISCEVLFYLLCPLFFLVVTSIKRSIIFCLFCVLVGIIFLKGVKPLFIDQLVSLYGYKLTNQFFYRNIFSQLTCFSFGFLLFHVYKTEKFKSILSANKNYYPLLLLSGLFAILTLSGLAKSFNHYSAGLTFFLFALTCYARPNKVIESKLLTFIGRVSFSAYIYHFLIIWLLFSVMGESVNFYSLSALTLIIVLPISYLSFKYVEMGTTRIAKSIVLRREVNS
jgi:peptidoglycan/LPS O-acetylase OafA/YrhL